MFNEFFAASPRSNFYQVPGGHRPKPRPASSPKTSIQDPPKSTKTSQISSGWSSEDFSQFMVQQDHQTQPISNDHLRLRNASPRNPNFDVFFIDSHPRRWGGVCFFSQKTAEHIWLYVVLSLNDPAVDLDDYEHEEEEEEEEESH